MKIFNLRRGTISILLPFNERFIANVVSFFKKHDVKILSIILLGISIFNYIYYYLNGLGLAYNDSRSHLDIGRRVVEGLKPGLAQIGSVWLPLTHLLMVPTIWNDFMWHTGLAGAVQSMFAFVFTGILIYLFLKNIGVEMLGRIVGVLIFVTNINILYLQSTAMTELMLIATMTAGAYELLKWFIKEDIMTIIRSAFWIMLSTLIRYDGWFLFLFAIMLIGIQLLRKKGYKVTEGTILMFCTLAGVGIVLWVLWNFLIFNDPLFFIFGPYSAYAQQDQLNAAGVLQTKGDLLFSTKVYFYALAFNSNTYITLLAAIGAIVFWFDKNITSSLKIAATTLIAPLIFNILALYLGHSVLFIQGLSGNTWFNVRYGITMMPSIAIFIGYLVQKSSQLKYVLLGTTIFVLLFSFISQDAVTIDDARVGSSQKNVSEVSGWLNKNAKDKKGFILISAASHDAIIFSSGLPMSRFIHEGTGLYWESATLTPDRWARWIVMRTNDNNDQTFKLTPKKVIQKKYRLVDHYPFADIYELKPEYLNELNTEPVYKNQK